MINLNEQAIREIIAKQFPTANYTIDSSTSRWAIRGEINGRYTSHRGILFVTASDDQRWAYSNEKWVKVNELMQEVK